jgi:diacylglycerol O-acyltransferase / wax synthase
MRRLPALDATFLELEDIDDASHMHIGGVMVFDPLPGGGTPSLEEIRVLVDTRLSRLPGFRERLSSPHTGGLEWPAWIEDDDFSVATHVRAEALPAPGDDATLEAWTAEFYAHRLDRGHALWEMVLLEGLEGGRWALANKTHHCMVDGVGSVDVGHVLLDASPEPPDDDFEPRVSEPGHEPAAPLRAAAAAVNAARSGAGAALHPRRSLGRVRDAVDWILREEVLAAPDSSINTEIGKHRRFAVVRADLAEVKTVKSAVGATVNEVVLAIVAGGLRALFEAREETPPDGMRAMVPVNLRTDDEHLAPGNRVSSLFVELPVGLPRAIEQLEWMRDRSQQMKRSTQAQGARAMLDATSIAPPVLHAAIAKSLYSRRLFNLTVTNVPGPQMTLYALGAPAREIWPLVPLFAGHSIGIAIVSYDGTLFFGINGDRDHAPDIDVLAAGMRATLDELTAAVAAYDPA